MDNQSGLDQESNNLIINYLPQMLTDTEFRNLFQSIGPVKAAKIIRHKSTGYSYGFGFVEYANENDATRAIETLNGFQLQNKKIKVAFSRPGGEEIKNANLYVRGIPRSYTDEEFREVMSPYGEIIQCRLLKDATGGRNKGVGFVLFNQKKQAEAAIADLNGKKLDGSTESLILKYAEDNAKKVRAPESMGGGYANPFGGPMQGPGGRFSGGGPLRQSVQGRFRFNPMTNNGGGIGGGMGYGGMGGYGSPPSALSVGGEGHILFVYNIGPDTDEKTIWQLFARYGTVQKVNVIREGGTGAGKGYGFVTMPSYDEAVLAIESLNGCNFFGKPLQVSFKSAK